jgi:DNA repair exonuclease SbcCD ATPase subunit
MISRGSEWRQWDLHVHTTASYDYEYRGEDADAKLIEAWKENGIEVVAITDHFLIDNEKIKKLRELANEEITIFPGVELRVDKASKNLHVILIFSEQENVDNLANDFQVLMRDRLAKASDRNETIYWDFADVVEYAKTKNGIISLHAGKKTSGLDNCITNHTPFEIAVKGEIASVTGIFEMGQTGDIDNYIERVIPVTGSKPLIICSDNHDPREYARKEKLWIKADKSFDGLLQVLNHPEERVFVGGVPPKVDKAEKGKSVYIESIKIQKDEDAKNPDSKWFDIDIPLNKGLSVVIGNKGSGKSAFADVLGHLCEANSMRDASFLNRDRFLRGPQKYGDDYSGSITWLDGKQSEIMKLSADLSVSTTQYAQYLPQKFIERVCTDLDKEFQEEINKVIYSYVDTTVRGESKNLKELIDLKSHPFMTRINTLKDELFELNAQIIYLEGRLTSKYRKEVDDKLSKTKEMLERHISTKPVEVIKPESKLSEKEQKRLSECDSKITDLEVKIENSRKCLTSKNSDISTLINVITDISTVTDSINHLNTKLYEIKETYFEEGTEIKVLYTDPTDIINKKVKELRKQKLELERVLDESDSATIESFYKQVEVEKTVKKGIVEKADSAEKTYQKYLNDLQTWNTRKTQLEGNETTENTVEYYLAEITKTDKDYKAKYIDLKEKRLKKVKEIFAEKGKIVSIHAEIYNPIEKKLTELLKEMEEKVDFKANVVLKDKDAGINLLRYVNHTFTGIFHKTDKAQVKMQGFLRDTEFSSEVSVLEFIEKVMRVIDENEEIFDRSSEIVKDKAGFYRDLFGLDYIGVEFNLNYSGRDLIELSPGERGLVLLIFYLALNQGEEPLIIDQPEDNLDNESVYKKLVPCIREAKKRRQVIIVTHNPNIAVACDAEQIIHCKIDKSKNEITYSAGSIENEAIRQKIIDVLEGTKPAFDLRSKKYIF